MSYIKTPAIVIKETNTGEADKIITILSREYGKLSVLARGARKPKSKFVACTQFWCYGNFLLFKKKDLSVLNSCDIIESFMDIGYDITKLTYAAHVVNLVYDTAQEEQSSAKSLKLLVNTIYYLAKTNRPPELITRIFELKYLCLLGYAPYVKGCMVCSNEDEKNMFFSFEKCGFICGKESCHSEDHHAKKVSTGTVKALRHVVYSDISKSFAFELGPDVLKEFGQIIDRYLKERLEKDYGDLMLL